MKAENVYLGHDNSNDLILMSDGAPQDLGGVTKMTLTFGTLKVSSSNGVNDPILWSKAGYQTGEIRIFVGKQAIPPGNYEVPLVVYDAGDPEGIVWDYIPLHVVAEVEGS